MGWGINAPESRSVAEIIVLLALLGGCRFDPVAVGGERLFPADGDLSFDGTPLPDGDPASDALVDARPPPDAWVCPDGDPPNHVGELSEGIQRWAAIYDTPLLGPMPPVITVRTESIGVQVGAESIRLDCSTDRCSLVYPADLDAGWDLSGFSRLRLTITAFNDNSNGWQEAGPQIRLYTSMNDFRTFRPLLNIVPRVNVIWVEAVVPLAGGDGWVATDEGTFDLTNVNALQIRQDTWDAGYIFWADGVTFEPGVFRDCSP